MRRSLAIVALALAVYGFAAWVYIALVALVHPHTLSMQLTHLASWPREDTFGEISFVVSFVAFIVYRSLRTAAAVRTDAGLPTAATSSEYGHPEHARAPSAEDYRQGGAHGALAARVARSDDEAARAAAGQ